MDIIERCYNGYKFKYLGNESTKLFDYTINPLDSFIISKIAFDNLINFLSKDLLDNVVYEKIYDRNLSSRMEMNYDN